jgi:uncharacterized protein (DUF1800 family)
MKVNYTFVWVLLIALLCSSFRKDKSAEAKPVFPYKQAGLSERQAAAHLLSRFTYGIKAGDIDKVVKMGLEKWFRQQLEGNIADDSLDFRLSQYQDLNLSNTEVENKYPTNAQALRMAIKDGSINKDSVNKDDGKKYREQIRAYMDKKGLEPEQELFRQFFNQKILRAASTKNQLSELLTDFWFNHFNVSLTKRQSAVFIPAYERDVIRPNVTGKFQTLLLATAKSPAMLTFLDNSSSSGQKASKTNNNKVQIPDSGSVIEKKREVSKKMRPKVKDGGLNENYAREVMELHTLGVDGGYSQNDVTQAARILTGWTLAPMGDYAGGSATRKLLERTGESNLEKRGFVHDGDFLFVPGRHDNGEKLVLGRRFPANGGYSEGVELLSMLAHQPATAGFISKKIAIRFVNDNPSARMVDEMAKTFTKTDGDIKQVMMAMVASPEFWTPEALRQKTKSPFELAISAVRSLNAEITQPYQLYLWIAKMGQKMYYYQAPTGFPDRGQYWINTGALLNRMNFGLALATERIPGIKIDLASLNNNHEPESAGAALLAYSRIILPERNLEETVKRLKPMLDDPELADKVEYAAANPNKEPKPQPFRKDYNKKVDGVIRASGNTAMLAQVVGVIIGSPEFQRK